MMKPAILSLTILLFYSVVIPWAGRLAPRLVDSTPIGRGHPRRNAVNAVRLVLSGTAQAAFCAALVALTGAGPQHWLSGRNVLGRAVCGVLLGFGEMALSSHLALVVIMAVEALASVDVPKVNDWHVLARGGWMQRYTSCLSVWASPFSYGIILLYITAEEIIFRPVLILAFGRVGPYAAVGASLVLFVTVQTFRMPNWRTAMFPVVGGLVVGVLHGLLFLAVADVVPLIIAHFVFFITAARLSMTSRDTCPVTSLTTY